MNCRAKDFWSSTNLQERAEKILTERRDRKVDSAWYTRMI